MTDLTQEEIQEYLVHHSDDYDSNTLFELYNEEENMSLGDTEISRRRH